MSKKQNKALVEKKGKTELSPIHIQAIQNVEDTGTAMFQAGQQMFIAVEEILRKEFNFTDDQLRHLEKEMTILMESLGFIEEKGLTVQSREDIKRVAFQARAIALMRQKRLKDDRKQIAAPSLDDIKKLK